MSEARTLNKEDAQELLAKIQHWANELGFQQVGISKPELTDDENRLNAWLAEGFHGKMDYMQRHGNKRSRPDELIPGTISIISVRMDYLPPDSKHPKAVLDKPGKGYVSRYALGRDYHKLIRNRLSVLAKKIQSEIGEFGYRAFVDSAPVLEKALARNAGLGWIGKHSNLINKQAGSWFFLGEIYTDLPLPCNDDEPKNYCGSCTACLRVCPTQAIVAPYTVDARRCISYLTIELRESIPEVLRPMMGNRIYGCDDCQLICPWNRFAQNTEEADFRARHGLDEPELIDLFEWTEEEFLTRTEGSAIRRIGYDCWLRNIAVALGNADFDETIVQALQQRQTHPSDLVREHVAWALQEQERKRA